MAIYGLQFHLEVDQAMMVRWLTVPENQEEIARPSGDVNPNHNYSATVRYIGRLHELSD